MSESDAYILGDVFTREFCLIKNKSNLNQFHLYGSKWEGKMQIFACPSENNNCVYICLYEFLHLKIYFI